MSLSVVWKFTSEKGDLIYGIHELLKISMVKLIDFKYPAIFGIDINPIKLRFSYENQVQNNFR